MASINTVRPVSLPSQESGQILVLTTFAMVALLGVSALALDTSYVFAKRNQLHAAADGAAKSGAFEIVRNGAVTQTALEAFADQQVAAHGFTPSRSGGSTVVTVNRPPATGAFAGNSSFVEVIVSEPTAMFFGRVLGFTSMTPGASAVAGAGNPSACFMTEEDFTIGNVSFVLNGCGVAVGEDIAGTNPNAEITGTPLPPVGVSGTCSGTCTGFGSMTLGAPYPVDPLAGLPVPTNPGGCVAGTAATIGPGCYTSIATSVRTLNAGIYYVTGPVNVANLTGNNVMIFLAAGGYIKSENNDELHLTAPTSGPYTGIAIFQDRANTTNFDAKNSFLLDVSGAIYMAGTDVDFKNHVEFRSAGCGLVIVKSLTLKNGNGLVTNGGCSAYAGAAFLTAVIVQ